MFRTCEGKTCIDAISCNECGNLLPHMCSAWGVPIMADAPCDNIYFTGVTDITISVGDEINLADGVHAYDGTGKEIAFTYSPTSIDTSEIGEYVVTYTASGIGGLIKPTMCGKNAVHMTECGYGTVKAYRTVTVEATDAVVCEALACESLAVCN